ncbi:MAG: NHL repeat-containing protein [Bacteroidota bacterium]|nr:NHL repeat-containing protein [Bacteroidota bacterium]MDP4233370.1 NHL repeat-containing protein [Bacteroidota bacterium]MDP4242236.1 NHL repeat-containing protein [Bacteroidota bacterium]MDP4286992.1 NHL repeat-containing protein [Bacteroidota bacterium]
MNARYCLALILIVSLAGCGSAQKTTVATAPITGSLERQNFLYPFERGTGLSIDQFGNIYAISMGRNTLAKFTHTGDSLAGVSGTGSDHYQFNGLFDVDARLSTAIFIADSRNHRIEQYTKDLAYVSTLQTRDNPDAAKRFGYPVAVAVDDAGNIYVADAENKRVLKVRSDYTVERVIGGFTDATRPEAIVTRPARLAVDQTERLFVLDDADNSVVEYDNLGNFIARRSLGPIPSATDMLPTRRLLTSNDTVFVFSPTEVALLRAPALDPIGRWTIVGTDDRRWVPTDMAMRNGIIYLLTPEGLSRYAVRSPGP